MKGEKPKSALLFNPDDIVAEIHQACKLDFAGETLAYLNRDTGARYPSELFAVNQIDACVKKYQRSDTDSDTLEDKAFAKFEKVNGYLRRVCKKRIFPYGEKKDSFRLPVRHRVHLKARALMHWVLRDLSEEEWFRACKFGPGSTVGVGYSDTSMEAKTAKPMTVTAGASLYLQRYLEWDFQFRSALHDRVGSDEVYRLVLGSRATTVDKTSEQRRMVCPEPTGNSFLQQGLMDVLFSRLRDVGLDIERLPEIHKELARLASILGHVSTVDWRSASDSQGIELFRWLTPPTWFTVLSALRSPFMEVKKVPLHLECFHTSGNACTFPMETLVLWVYAHACASVAAGEHSLYPDWERRKNSISVFGDDCIIPTNITSMFIDVLEGVGMEVNEDKTFVGDDTFRESCGGDYLRGYSVRPFSITAPSNTKRSGLESWLYILVNGFQKKYIHYFGPLTWVYDKAVFYVLARLFKEHNIHPKVVPPDFPEDSGIQDLDGLRFLSVYGLTADSIHVDVHGTYTFRFLRFVYDTRLDVDPQLRTWDFLARKSDRPYSAHPLDLRSCLSIGSKRRTCVVATRDTPKRWVRRKGGYVVAKTLSSHWECTLATG
jgi:hypothetical protein